MKPVECPPSASARSSSASTAVATSSSTTTTSDSALNTAIDQPQQSPTSQQQQSSSNTNPPQQHQPQARKRSHKHQSSSGPRTSRQSTAQPPPTKRSTAHQRRLSSSTSPSVSPSPSARAASRCSTASSATTVPSSGPLAGLIDPLAEVRAKIGNKPAAAGASTGRSSTKSKSSTSSTSAADPPLAERRLTRSQLRAQLSAVQGPSTAEPAETLSSTAAASSSTSSSSARSRSRRGRPSGQNQANQQSSTSVASWSSSSASLAAPPGLTASGQTSRPPATTGICHSANSAEIGPSANSSSTVQTRLPADASAAAAAAFNNNNNNSNLPPVLQAQSSVATTVGQELVNMAQGTRTSGTAAASHFLGSLVPRVQQMLAGAAHQHNAKMSNIMEALRSGDETRQQDAASELAEMLLLGNEDSLQTLPVRDIVQALCSCLQHNEHNLELSLTVTRCITNLLEALPRAVPLLLDAVPLLLNKLTRIECIDVAEQALAALEVLSRRHGKSIMQNGGIAATISHLDFFNAASQRVALNIAANCAQYVSAHDFNAHVQPCLNELTQRFMLEDKRALESVCLLFSRLVDNMRNSPDKLSEMASHGLLTNVQHLVGYGLMLLTQPPAVGPSCFQSVIRMLRQLCTRCPHLTVQLLQMDLTRTLRILLTGNDDMDATEFELLNRPPPQLQEIVLLIGELLPKLPCTGLFEIDGALTRQPVTIDTSTIWQYADDEAQWHNFQWYESRILEMCYQYGEREVPLSMAGGHTSTVNLHRMTQVDDATGTTRQVQRHINASARKAKSDAADMDAREKLLETNPELAATVVRWLFPVLVEIDASSAGPTIRFDTLRTMLRMIQPSSSQLLKDVLLNVQFACHIASGLSSQRSKDLPTVATAIQLIGLLAEKLPDVYISAFRREGVVHQLQKLSHLSLEDTPHGSPVPSSREAALTRHAFSAGELSHAMSNNNSLTASTTPSNNNNTGSTTSSSAGHHHSASAGGSSSATPTGRTHGRESRKKAFLNSLRLPAFGRHNTTSSANTSTDTSGAGASGLSASLHSARSTPSLPNAPGSQPSSASSRRTKRRHMMGTPTSATTVDSTNASTSSRHRGLTVQLPVPPPPPAAVTLVPGQVSSAVSGSQPALNVVASSSSSTSTPNVASSTNTLQVHMLAPSNVPMTAPPVFMGLPVTSNAAAHYSLLTSMSQAAAAASAGHTYTTSSSSSSGLPPPLAMYHASMLNQHQKRRLRMWIKTTATKFIEQYFSTADGDECDTVERMSQVAKKLLDPTSDHGTAPLILLSDELTKASLSAFELSHSGLVGTLIKYLTDTSDTMVTSRSIRLKRFVDIFLGIQLRGSTIHVMPDGCQALSCLVQRLLSCVAQSEQFPVRTNDIPATQQQGGGTLRGANALRFFQTHQIKCVLRRHPSAVSDLREWRHGHGSIRVDPLTPVAAVERYLLERGVLRRGNSNQDDDELDTTSGDDRDTSDDELEQAARYNAFRRSGEENRQLQLILNDQVLPSNLTILQAIRQFGLGSSGLGGSDMDTVALAASIWVNTHCLWYRLAPEQSSTAGANNASGSTDTADGQAASSSNLNANNNNNKKKRRSPARNSRQVDKLWTEGLVPVRVCPLDAFLVDTLPRDVDDPSVEFLVLLRIVFGLNTNWCYVFKEHMSGWPSSVQSLLPASQFVSAKLAAKANRQLNDVLSVATQYLPSWLTHIASCCAFLLPFNVRRQLLYACAFGRERALAHVASAEPSSNNETDHNRLTPRLDRKKVVVKREDILRQSQDTLLRMGSARPLLEVSFEGETGTGNGPTLEFYSNLSRELQRFSLKLFHGDKQRKPAEHQGGAMMEYVFAVYGLYPCPYPTTGGGAKQRDQRMKHFEFIGRLMGQALIDTRMLDIPLSTTFYRWLLAEDGEMSVADLEQLDPVLWRSTRSLLSMSAKDLDDMCLNFTLPGYENIELMKGGAAIAVDKQNVQQFVELVAHWRLVAGVHREMEAMCRGIRTVVDLNHLKWFYAHELDELFCGSASDAHWEAAALRAAIKPDHGFTHDSPQIQWLVQMMASFDSERRRKFLQFVTGSPKLPVGGFRGLTPCLTAVRKTVPHPDQDLPSAMTCYNYLKVPAYSSYDVFVNKFEIAMQHVYAFFLT